MASRHDNYGGSPAAALPRREGRGSQGDAFEDALALWRAPGAARRIREGALASDLGFVVRVAAGFDESCACAAERSGLGAEEVQKAAQLYLMVALFGGRGGAHRVMGLAQDTSVDEIRERRSWLLKWLHPDINHNPFVTPLVTRVLDASGELLRAVRNGGTREVAGNTMVDGKWGEDDGYGRSGQGPDGRLASVSIRRHKWLVVPNP